MEEVAKVEIVSKNTIKPSSQTPSHLQHFKLSRFDHIVPRWYVPVVLFYPPSDDSDHSFAKISHKLKASLSQILTLYYPFCGRLKGYKSNSHVDCNDQGVLYLEAKIPLKLSDFLKGNSGNNPQSNEIIKSFLPIYPFSGKPGNNEEHPFIMGVQVTEFTCGSVGIGACISHVVCDGTTIASFLRAWSKRALMEKINEDDDDFAPNMQASLFFPAKEMDIDLESVLMRYDEENISTRRFLFSGNSLCELRDKLTTLNPYYKPTRVEVVTALIWKSALEATGGASHSSVAHIVNIRNRMVPPLPENTIGNLWNQALSPLMELDKLKEIKLQDMVEVVRKTIGKIDKDFVSTLQGDDATGFVEALREWKELIFLMKEKGVSYYSFSSWIRFGFYEVNFGFGKPTWVCTLGVPIKNSTILMPSKCEDGIEAWVSLSELHMAHFESNPDLLQFASFDY